jgi:hypothetical protein
MSSTLIKPDANGVVNIPTGTWANPSVQPVVRRIPAAKRLSAAELLERVNTVGEQITAAADEFDRTKGTDPYSEQKQELLDYLSQHERRVAEAKAELQRLQLLPDPRTNFITRLAQLEYETSATASEARETLMERVAVDLYDTELKHLSSNTKSEIRARTSIRGLDQFVSKYFTRFGRTAEKERTLEQASECVSRCLEALTVIGQTVSKANK